MRKALWTSAIALMLLALLVVSCSTPTPSPSPAPTPTTKPATSAPAPSPTATAVAKRIPWRIYTTGVSRGFTRGMEFWADEMKKRTLLEPQIFWGGVLGSTDNIPDGVKDGLYEMAVALSVYHPSKTPLNSVMDLPFLGPSSITAIAYWCQYVTKHPTMTKFMADKWNILELQPLIVGQYQAVSNRPLKTVDDFKGIKIRIPGVVGDVLKKYGAVPTMVPSTESYTAMQKGTVEATVLTWDGLNNYKLQEISKYLARFDFSTAGDILLVNNKTWQAMSPEIKKANEDISAEYMNQIITAIEKSERAAFELLKSKMDYSVFPKAEREKLVASSADAYEVWIKSMEKDYGIPDARAFFNDVKKKADELNAKYPSTW